MLSRSSVVNATRQVNRRVDGDLSRVYLGQNAFALSFMLNGEFSAAHRPIRRRKRVRRQHRADRSNVSEVEEKLLVDARRVWMDLLRTSRARGLYLL